MASVSRLIVWSMFLLGTPAFLILQGSVTPIARLAELSNANLRFRVEILKPERSQDFSHEQVAPKEDSTLMGVEMAQKLLSKAGSDFFL